MARVFSAIPIDQESPWFDQTEGVEDYYFDPFFTNIDDDEDEEELLDDQNRKEHPFSVACLEILKSYGKFFNKPKNNGVVAACGGGGGGKLPVNERLMLAGERYIQQATQMADGFSMFMHPYGSAISGLSVEELSDVELLHLLLSAADDVGCHQYDVATNLISRCLLTASDSGNPVQRLVFYFTEALKQRIDRETGRFNPLKSEEERRSRYQDCMGLSSSPATLAFHQGLPFSQVMQFSGIQAILENVKNAGKIHLIDLNIRSGIQWTILMQALAEQTDCRPELIKITAVGVTDKQKMEESGNRLKSFASSCNLPFVFNLVFLSDLKDFREDLVHSEADEAVAVYANIVLRTMITRPDCLDSVMREIRKLEPVAMVITEVEANHNSPSFISRFVEALFYYGAFFDCFEDCMERNDPGRRTIEGIHFGEGIINIVAAEGAERFTRNVKIDVWRAFFSRFGMVEIQVSESSTYQAKLILNQFEHGSSCNVVSNGKGLIVGWKGTPIHSITCWKFS